MVEHLLIERPRKILSQQPQALFQQLAESIKLIQITWRNCAVADELWVLRTMSVPLDSMYSGLSIALLETVPWVEQQLQRFN